MDALRSNFGAALVAVMAVVVATVLATTWARRRASTSDAVGHVLVAGATALAVAATALPRSWPPDRDGWGDLVLGVGRAGLSDWRLLADPLATLAAVELWANVAVYIPLGAAAWVATRSATRSVGLGIALSMAIEAWQWAALSRIAATDDVLLNTAGTALGVVAAAGLTRAINGRAGGSDEPTERG